MNGMRVFVWMVLAALVSGSELTAQQASGDHRAIVLHAARLLDIGSGRIVSPGEVLVEGERIVAAGSSVEHPAGAEVIDLGDATLMPGLIDAHVHLFLHPGAEDLQTVQESVPERTLIVRDNPVPGTPTGNVPAWDLSLNYIPVASPAYTPAVIAMKPQQKQFWRVLNASAITYLDLQVLFNGTPQLLGVVALDGVPIDENGDLAHSALWKTHILMPPAGRAEIIVKGPAEGVQASLVTRTVDTGPAGENDPTRPLATIVASREAPETHSRLPLISQPVASRSAADGTLVASTRPIVPAHANSSWLGDVAPVRERKLYFSEEPLDPKDPSSPTKFYITVEGEKPVQFDPRATAPNITVRQGDVEDWIIENRSTELHAFHIHQIHFILKEWNGIPLDEPYLRDTINVQYWDGHSPVYPSVRLRMDFRDPRIVGTFVYHCHLLEHEDGGMMGTIRVEASVKKQ